MTPKGGTQIKPGSRAGKQLDEEDAHSASKSPLKGLVQNQRQLFGFQR